MNLHTPRVMLVLTISLPMATSMAAIELSNDPSLPASADGFNITRDTSTGFEWLDLDVSAGRTFDDLTGVDGSNEFGPGGDYEGFRYATHEQLTGAFNGPQLDSLYKSLGISPFSFSSIGGYAPARALITIAGCFGSCGVYGYSNGILLADDGVTEAVASMEAFTSQGSNWGRSEPFGGPVLFVPNNEFPLEQGNWLIRDVSDIDGDGVADAQDNCTLIANPDQRDTNGDGFGNVCDADLNNDGVINPADLGLFRAVFLSNDADADFNGDGVVNPADLGIMRAAFLGAPGPSGAL